MYSHRPRRRFGQNFLIDAGYIQRIVEAIGPHRSDRVVEIGPGLGALTGPLLEHLDSLHVVEIDRDIVAGLVARFPGERLVVHQGDALEFDFAAMGSGLRLVGNLPYNISTPMLFHTARFAACIRDCHFMLQEEVVDRMAAQPGGKRFGRLSVMLQYRFRVEKLFDVPPGVFRPVPRVNSAMARLTPHTVLPAPAQDEALLAQVVSKAFSQRRKTLRNALAGYASAEDLAALGLDPRLRPENLSLEDFVCLANTIARRARQTCS